MEGRPQPLDAEGLFADWLAGSGTEDGFEALCRQHGEHAATLRELHADWQRLRAILRRAGLGISAEHGHSFALRLKEQYGSGVDPEIALERGEDRGEAPASSQLLKRLAAHALRGSRYQLKGELARGGMGAILKVWDEDLRRSLAMKVILGKAEAPSEGTPQVDRRLLARFLEEAQVTGQLDHPGIVPVHELGLDAEGRVYFTMKLVKGRDLKTIFDLVFEEREGWNETRALGVILKVCEAMAYAHAKGVVHRDLKPANVMVGNFGEVFVMDWGLARVLGREDQHDLRLRPETTSVTSVKTERREERSDSPDSPILTMDGDIVGTPAYMPPEQARGEIEKIGPHSDVYAIGAVLYHLLARQMPFVPGGARMTNRMVLMRVVDGPPAALSSVRRGIPVELVAICEKAMAREPAQRYRDTSALARDVAAFLEKRVVAAYRTGPWQELRTWIRRNRPLFVTGVAAVLALLLLLAGLVFQIDRERRRTEVQIANDRRERYAENLGAVRTALEAKSIEVSWTRLEQCPESLRGWEWGHAALMAGALVDEKGPSAGDARVTWSPDGRWLAATVGGYAVALIESDRGEVRDLLHDGWVEDLAWSPDGQRLATFCTGDDPVVRIWVAASGELERSLTATDRIDGVSWAPTGRLLASRASDATIQVWDPSTGGLLASFPDADEVLSWCPRGELLACVDDEGTIHLWTPEGGEIQAIEGASSALSWNPGGSLLAWQKNGVEVWDMAKRSRSRLLEHPPASNRAVSWSFDGAWFAWTGPDRPIVQGLGSDEQRVNLDVGGASGLVWNPAARILAFARNAQNVVAVWDEQTRATTRLYGHLADIEKLAWSADGERLATLSDDTTVRIWDPDSLAAPHVLRGSESWPVDFGWSPVGRRLATVSEGGIITLWDGTTGEAVREWPSLETVGQTSRKRTSEGSTAWHWPWSFAAERGEPSDGLVREGDVLGVSWSPTGPRSVSEDWEDELPVLRVGPTEDGIAFAGHEDWVTCVQWHPDGRLLSGSEDKTARIWNGRTSVVLRGHGEKVTAVAWAPSGELVATGSADASIRIWNAATGAALHVLSGHNGPVLSLAWHPTGIALASAGNDGSVRIWDGASGVDERTLAGHTAPVTAVAWNDSGDLLASASEDGSIRLWKGRQGELSGELLGHERGVAALSWNPDGSRLASFGHDNTLVIWDAEQRRRLYSRSIFPDQKHYDEENNLVSVPAVFEAGDGLGLQWSPDAHRLAVWQESEILVLDSRIEDVLERWHAKLQEDREEWDADYEEDRATMIERLVADLFATGVLRERVLERLDTYPALAESDRLLAREMAAKIDAPDPTALDDEAWSLVRPLDAHEPEAIDRGLKLAIVARDLAPENASIRHTLAWASYAKGDRAAALAEMERAVELEGEGDQRAYGRSLELMRALLEGRAKIDPSDATSLRDYWWICVGNSASVAVERGLLWLSLHQSPDGSWDCDGFSARCPANGEACDGPGGTAHDVGVTGLALLAFLRVGQGVEGSNYHRTVADGIDYLLSKQDPEGLIGGRETQSFLYNHAIATLALCESYGLMRATHLVEPCRNAVSFILKARNPYQAWRYDAPPLGDNDTSVTGWMVLALVAARDAGIIESQEPGALKQALDGAFDFINAVSDAVSGRVGYDSFGSLSSRYPYNEHHPREKGEAMTAVGLLCRVLLNQQPEWRPVLLKHAERLQSKPPVWDPNGFGSDMYYWFFGSQAMFQIGGKLWQDWDRAMQGILKNAMNRQGHRAGSWDPVDPWGSVGGRVYSTAMMVLCAEAAFAHPRIAQWR